MVCVECGQPATVLTGAIVKHSDGPLCTACFRRVARSHRKANQMRGLCACGELPTPGVNPRTRRRWASCASCRSKRCEHRADRRDREVIREGRARGWRPALAHFQLTDPLAATSFPSLFEEALEFMRAVQSRRDRKRQRREAREGRMKAPSTADSGDDPL